MSGQDAPGRPGDDEPTEVRPADPFAPPVAEPPRDAGDDAPSVDLSGAVGAAGRDEDTAVGEQGVERPAGDDAGSDTFGVGVASEPGRVAGHDRAGEPDGLPVESAREPEPEPEPVEPQPEPVEPAATFSTGPDVLPVEPTPTVAPGDATGEHPAGTAAPEGDWLRPDDEASRATLPPQGADGVQAKAQEFFEKPEGKVVGAFLGGVVVSFVLKRLGRG